MKLPKAYSPADYETDIYALWEKSGAFLPVNRGGAGHYSLAAPPPNANANLHIGYGLTIAIEDTLVRYNRMLGKETVFIPGADHAGFETWVVYEKQLEARGKSRFDYSREELYSQIWDFVEQNKHNFQSQLRALGASFDWSRFTYTLDNKVVATTYQIFQKMWQEGLIYRGERIVNFCTLHGTAFADIEVEYKQEEGKLWHIRYPLTDGAGEIVVATARPETMLGDSAVAVHPDDKRYKELVGKKVKLPLVGREIPIVADEMVDSEFGSGAVKVTPAHDQNDFEVSQRHNLEIIPVISYEGAITDEAPEAYRGLTVKEARKKVVEDLKGQGFLAKTEDYMHSVGHCYKCGTVIEPLLKEQWFVDMKPLAKPAMEALKDKKIRFYPDSKREQLIRYLGNLKDWNISRQIAWGIPIPAFQNVEKPDDWIFDERVNQETIEVNGQMYRRDPDVFDTWFSSGQWPYVTLDWPGSEDFKKFYPLSLMETGGEILYQWVARMIMLGLFATGEIPFKDVYIHGYVMASDGQKMSKSLGNVIDLMETIGKYGSDATRMGLLAGRAPAVNRGYDERRVEEARNFNNKLWNVARFVEAKVGDQHDLRHKPEPKSPADHWILNMLSISAKQISDYIEDYRLSEAYETLYHFIWDDLADWYVEVSKSENNLGLLAFMLESALKLAHPFAPFVTETIWQTLAWEDGTMLATQPWPKDIQADESKAKDFETVRSVVEEIRRIRSVVELKKPELIYKESEVIKAHTELIKKLAGAGAVTEAKGKSSGLRLPVSDTEVWLNVEAGVAAKYLSQLKVSQKQREEAIELLQKRLEDQGYLSKAPGELVEQTKDQLTDEKAQLEQLETEIKNLKL